ncbi:3-deoxy-manno-octulosonate cytidylyltransferase [termite gut metagenome]|uniref:3-deoxy-manno-octulosonate cytidylyltransferase n=1 Tax=termite gut metagenome TaxID=433724 RepID=A0A5J4RZJ2_9ZZZZ
MKFKAIIPARYASTRFPGKPLAELGGKSVIQRVYEQVIKVFDDVYVATDDERIEQAVKSFGGNLVMTSATHQSGTERCYEACVKTGGGVDTVVVNVQGDEPFVQPSQLEELTKCFYNASTQIATLVTPFPVDSGFDGLVNVNSPKVVFDKDRYALYFSRSVIPFQRNVDKTVWAENHTYYKHIGLYAYRFDVLKEIVCLPLSPLERAESLEQLRWIENGYKIKVGITSVETIGIDTPEDLELAERFISRFT